SFPRCHYRAGSVPCLFCCVETDRCRTRHTWAINQYPCWIWLDGIHQPSRESCKSDTRLDSIQQVETQTRVPKNSLLRSFLQEKPGLLKEKVNRQSENRMVWSTCRVLKELSWATNLLNCGNQMV